MRLKPILIPFVLFAGLLNPSAAQDNLPGAKPVPRVQVLPLPRDETSITRDGEEFARFYFHEDLNRPFLYPLIGPAGRPLTRMGHPHDPNGHSHHNSVWISHHDVNGVDFWGDGGKGRILTQKILRYVDGEDEAAIEVENVWKDGEGATLLNERRLMRFRPLPDGEWLLMIEIELTPAEGPVTFGKTPFGLVGVRMAKTIGVHDGGGTIRNSAGEVNEQGVFWKPARWVDYAGPIAPDTIEGITLFDHPDNPNHPATFHVRDDGWMGASLTFDGPLEVTAEKPLLVRYGLWIHAGLPSAEEIDAQFEDFSRRGVVKVE